jgi:hypothetical protein
LGKALQPISDGARDIPIGRAEAAASLAMPPCGIAKLPDEPD